jgi:predicted transcriptional regulator
MPSVALAVPASISRRIAKLAAEAGRTPDQILKFVLRDGLDQTEYAVREANAGLAELAAGKGISLADVKRRTSERRQRRAD